MVNFDKSTIGLHLIFISIVKIIIKILFLYLFLYKILFLYPWWISPIHVGLAQHPIKRAGDAVSHN